MWWLLYLVSLSHHLQLCNLGSFLGPCIAKTAFLVNASINLPFVTQFKVTKSDQTKPKTILEYFKLAIWKTVFSVQTSFILLFYLLHRLHLSINHFNLVMFYSNKDKRSYKFASRICKISKVKFRIAWLEILFQLIDSWLTIIWNALDYSSGYTACVKLLLLLCCYAVTLKLPKVIVVVAVGGHDKSLIG